MSRCLFTYDFFADGRSDALSEVRILQHEGLWTKQKRASWIKQAKSSYERLLHARCLPQASAYYAGRLSALKSRLTADFSGSSEQKAEVATDTIVYRALPFSVHRPCSLFDCGDNATWGVSFQGDPTLFLVLCDPCRQEWERMQTVYTKDSGWDWDDDEIELFEILVPPRRNQLVQIKEETLALGRIVLPLAFLMGFDLSNLISPTSHRAMFAELGLVVLVRWQSTNMLHLLFFLSSLLNRKEEQP